MECTEARRENIRLEKLRNRHEKALTEVFQRLLTDAGQGFGGVRVEDVRGVVAAFSCLRGVLAVVQWAVGLSPEALNPEALSPINPKNSS